MGQTKKKFFLILLHIYINFDQTTIMYLLIFSQGCIKFSFLTRNHKLVILNIRDKGKVRTKCLESKYVGHGHKKNGFDRFRNLFFTSIKDTNFSYLTN
jgi:hypothetical protein